MAVGPRAHLAVVTRAIFGISTPALASAGGLGPHLSPWSILPFVGMLASIAVLPAVAPSFWHHQRNQLAVALGWAAPVLGLLLWLAGTPALRPEALGALGHAATEYTSFIVLIGALYVISGGILVTGDLRATPRVNAGFLLVGAVLANLVGTTGASMLLIRPLLRTNSQRRHRWHIPVFFIFVVSNIGGALTPIGDPPLFLGYLRGVPFGWTVVNLVEEWAFTVLAVTAVFVVFDSVQYAKEESSSRIADIRAYAPIRITGWINAGLLLGVTVAVLALTPDEANPDLRRFHLRELALIALAWASVRATPAGIRDQNEFEYAPILEVAALFVGIFVTMIPATALLAAHGGGLGLDQPWQYFWASGGLSSILDNAPTYATFAAMACGSTPSCVSPDHLAPLTVDPTASALLVAISLGSVFMGAGSYIGNGPNFMVRAVAERAGYPMPTFLGYSMYAVLFLGPVFLLVTRIFLWG